MAIPVINPALLTRQPLKVKIVKVESPTFFWVQLENGAEEFEEYLEELARFMDRRGCFLHHWPHNIQLDDLAVIQEGKLWQRGIVTQIEENDMITVFLRDWGRTVRRRISECYQLKERFHRQPWAAIPCGLANIKPIGVISNWPQRTNRLTQLLIDKRSGWMKIKATHLDEAAAVDIKLEQRSKEELDEAKTLLIRVGCAQHSNQRMFKGPPNN